MNKLNLIILLLTTLFWNCEQPKEFTMNMPDTMPPLLTVQKGLSPELKKEHVVFEKYIRRKIRTATGTKLYANGDLYKIRLGYNDTLKSDNVLWKKVGTISPKGLEKIEKISKSSVVDFIKKDDYEIIHSPFASIKWYFYFDQPKFARTQNKRGILFCWQKPRFVCQMDKTIERYLTYEYEKE